MAAMAGSSALALLASSWLVLGSPFAALSFLPGGRFAHVVPEVVPLAACAAIGWALLAFLALRRGWPSAPLALASVAVLALGSWAVGARVDERRAAVAEAFRAECVRLAPLRRSFAEAPRELQLFLHGEAVKDGEPHAWSYREMAFYPLSDNVWPNVLSPEIRRCLAAARNASTDT